VATPNLQLEGGNFQNASGAVIAGGKLLLTISHDESYASGPSQIVGGQKFTVTLDNNGNIPVSPAFKVYDNADLLPSGSFYIVRLFDSTGAEVWASPQYWTLLASPNPIDVGTIVPTNPPGSGLNSGGATLLLQTNEVNNGSQSLLDLHAGTNITLTDNGSGRVTIASTGGPTFNTTGQGYFFGPGIFEPISVVTRTTGASWVAAPNTVYVIQFTMHVSFQVSKFSINVIGNAIGKHAGFGIYSADGNTKYVDSGAMSVGSIAIVTSSISPVTLSPGTYFWAQTSDGSTAQINISTSAGTNDVALMNANASFPRYALAANASAAGVLPATLGALTAASGVTLFDTALVMMEP